MPASNIVPMPPQFLEDSASWASRFRGVNPEQAASHSQDKIAYAQALQAQQAAHMATLAETDKTIAGIQAKHQQLQMQAERQHLLNQVTIAQENRRASVDNARLTQQMAIHDHNTGMSQSVADAIRNYGLGSPGYYQAVKDASVKYPAQTEFKGDVATANQYFKDNSWTNKPDAAGTTVPVTAVVAHAKATGVMEYHQRASQAAAAEAIKGMSANGPTPPYKAQADWDMAAKQATQLEIQYPSLKAPVVQAPVQPATPPGATPPPVPSGTPVTAPPVLNQVPPAGPTADPTPHPMEGQTVRSKSTGQMGAIVNGQFVPNQQ